MSLISLHMLRLLTLCSLLLSNGGLRENQAVTREWLARSRSRLWSLSVAASCLLSLRGRIWFEMDGRQINGIATARSLGTRDGWEIDTLALTRSLDAVRAEEVAQGLLKQVAEAAAGAHVGHVLLRTQVGGVAVQGALRTGFVSALEERLWAGSKLRVSIGGGPQSMRVRKVEVADMSDLFRLYNRAVPVAARQALAMTMEEWCALEERRWIGRRGERWLAEVEGRVVALLYINGQGSSGQLELLCDPSVYVAGDGAINDREVPGRVGGAALLAYAADATTRCDRVVSLVPKASSVVEDLLRDHGLAPSGDLQRFALRTRQRVVDPARQSRDVVLHGRS